MQAKLSIRNLFKVFGKSPKKALTMLKDGRNKDEIFTSTGMTVGVNNASFDIHEGEIFVIMGLSGSGKSTLVRMLNRLIEPSSGQVLLNGVDIAKLDEERLRQARLNQISMVFQSFALMPHMTVGENVHFGLDLAGSLSKPERIRKAQEALARVGLEEHFHSYPKELSGGMQQRVGLARALCVDPEILLMDEAFSALDPLIRTEMQDELIRLQAEDKRTIVFISHDLDEAVRIGDRIAIMQGGEVVQVGSPDDIVNNPANDYVRSFFRGVDITSILTAKDVARRKQATIIKKTSDTGVGAGLQILEDHDRDFGYVVDSENHFIGVVSVDSLEVAKKQHSPIEQALLDTPNSISAETPIGELISTVAKAPCAPPVIDTSGKFLGAISKTILLEALDRQSGDTL